METHEIALLVVVATPVVLIAGMNLLLALTGERDTLLMPLPRDLTFPQALEVLDRVESARIAAEIEVACPVAEPQVAAPQPEPALEALAREPETRPVFVARPAFSALRRFPLADDVVRT